jgi:integrase/recombinase XerD
VVKPKTPPVERIWYCEQEVWRILSAAEDLATFLIIALAFYGGLRRFEIAKVHASDILENELCVVGKGNKTRFVTLPRCIFDKLREATEVSENGFLFKSSKRLEHISCSTADRWAKKAANRAGFGKFHLHQLRYSFATELFNRGVEISSIQELLGHSDMRTTQLYIQSEKQKVFDDYNRAFANASDLTFEV